MLIVGAGEMAGAYVETLRTLGHDDVSVVGRGRESAARFGSRYGIRVRAGGTEALGDVDVPAAAIVAVGHPALAEVTAALLERGCRSVLVEKPGALHRAELDRLRAASGSDGAAVYVAYNRRFYPSVDAVRRAIADDGALLSCSFDFSELEPRVLANARAKGLGADELARWGVLNSLHVIDLAFHLAGIPATWERHRAGALPWHPAGAVFAGAGTTDRDVLFSYLATWAGAGRWGLEVTTPEHKLVLRPLEELAVQQRDGFALVPVALEPEPPGLKPGLHGQVAAFLAAAAGSEPDPRLCGLDEAVLHYDVAESMLGYR